MTVSESSKRAWAQLRATGEFSNRKEELAKLIIYKPGLSRRELATIAGYEPSGCSAAFKALVDEGTVVELDGICGITGNRTAVLEFNYGIGGSLA